MLCLVSLTRKSARFSLSQLSRSCTEFFLLARGGVAQVRRLLNTSSCVIPAARSSVTATLPPSLKTAASKCSGSISSWLNWIRYVSAASKTHVVHQTAEFPSTWQSAPDLQPIPQCCSEVRGDCRIEKLLVSWCRKTRINTLSITEEPRKHRTMRSLVLTHQANQQILDVNGVGAALSRCESCDENHDSGPT